MYIQLSIRRKKEMIDWILMTINSLSLNYIFKLRDLQPSAYSQNFMKRA